MLLIFRPFLCSFCSNRKLTEVWPGIQKPLKGSQGGPGLMLSVVDSRSSSNAFQLYCHIVNEGHVSYRFLAYPKQYGLLSDILSWDLETQKTKEKNEVCFGFESGNSGWDASLNSKHVWLESSLTLPGWARMPRTQFPVRGWRLLRVCPSLPSSLFSHLSATPLPAEAQLQLEKAKLDGDKRSLKPTS